ncbi:phosphate ABC transporter permease [Haloarcula hispanica N601]|uniref:Phosphate transport system permease protein PstA n=2 Tax=Haloarcula hispanica TaxID=51589 RepID=V5TPD4_HALHI|nr:phosphate ABC transporter permease PstA [Haloarcula hispanica]AEM58215.1 phosphate ABC transporter permease protein [Haloarcula hispanica ATCC 33960]AHB66953.1 phosphate ABC transporter permease [Haloarcula hispanica N601]
MSDAYATTDRLVSADSNSYDRGLDTAIALSVVGFTLGLITLVNLVPPGASGSALTTALGTLLAVVVGAVGITGLASYTNVVPVTSQRVRGIGLGLVVSTLALTALAAVLPVTMATLLGTVLLAEALAITAAGVSSRLELVDTEPNMSAGLLSGGALGAVGLAMGAAIGGALTSAGSLLWLVGAVVAGVGLFLLAILPREDLGSTLPTAIVVGALGLTIVTGTIGVGWQWNPQTLSGGFTGGAVIPVFLLVGTLLSAWSAAKCRAGFGARGREYGAFLVINLNAFLMVAVMATIVVFVTFKGVGYAFHGLSVGALTALVLLTPALLAAVQFARTPAGTNDWNSGARQLFRLLPLAAVGALAAVLVSVLVTGSPLRYSYAYIVQVNRQGQPLDTALAVTPDTTVGPLLLLAPAVLLAVTFFRSFGSLRNVGTQSERAGSIRQAVPTAILALVVLIGFFLVLGPAPFGLPLGGTLGLAAVVAGAVAAGGLAVYPLVGVLTTDGPTLADSAQREAPLFTLGVFGGLGLLVTALLLQPVAGVNPQLGPVNLVPAVAFAAAIASLALATLTTVAKRSSDETITRRLLTEETRLGLIGAAGFTALVGLHVAATGVSFTVLGVAVSNEGSLSWPMVMQAYIPLGAEPGGIMPAIVGTVWLVVGATLFAVPLGVGAAVFLTEYAEQGEFTAVVEIATNALWSTPSIVFGLFGAAFLIPRLGGDESLLAGMLVLGFMLLPLVLITSRESIKAVPDEYRDASAALGVTQWETIKSVVLPAAMPGVITGVILGVGRIAGETAPLILVLGSTLNATESVDVIDGFRFVSGPPFIANDALLTASASLPTQVWAVIAAGVSGSPQMGWATAFILLMVVLTFYAVGITARTYFRRKLNYE